MPVWMALALQAAPLGGTTVADPVVLKSLPDRTILSLLPRCGSTGSSDEIVVCGRANRDHDRRLPKLDPRFEQSRLDSGLFTLRLSDQATIGGGGPKGSVGITLKVGF